MKGLFRALWRLTLVASLLSIAAASYGADLSAALAKIRAVSAQGAGHADALSAVKTVSQAAPGDLPQILAAMDGANPIAVNWLRVAAESLADRAVAAGKLPAPDLERFLADTKHSPRGRRLAYELVALVDPAAEKRLIPKLLDDPSLELRRDAVAQLLAGAATLTEKSQATPQYQQALHHARDFDQIKEAADKLKALGQSPDIAAHLGFVMSWKVIGPFDNIDDRGWDATYPPEKKVELAAEHDGQKGKVKWTDHTTADEYGQVDLNNVLGKHKGAIAYVVAEFLADRERPCELRLGTPNANKIWLNRQQIGATHVYHLNTAMDQYVAGGKLKPGKNTILLKICQNEQTEEYAQVWTFQLRVCDQIGTAILSQDRKNSVRVRE